MVLRRPGSWRQMAKINAPVCMLREISVAIGDDIIGDLYESG
jgi:hypothetical protein